MRFKYITSSSKCLNAEIALGAPLESLICWFVATYDLEYVPLMIKSVALYMWEEVQEAMQYEYVFE